MNLIPFAEYLETAGLGEQGRSLFVNYYPAEVTTGVFLRNKLFGMSIDHNLPGYLKFSFQAVIRSNNFTTGEALAKDVAKTLHLNDVTLGDMKVNYCRPVNIPYPYPISDGELVEFNVEFDVCVWVSEWE